MQTRGLFVDAARVRAPRDKGRVENQIAFVRENWFDGETFTSIVAARQSADHWSAASAKASPRFESDADRSRVTPAESRPLHPAKQGERWPHEPATNGSCPLAGGPIILQRGWPHHPAKNCRSVAA